MNAEKLRTLLKAREPGTGPPPGAGGLRGGGCWGPGSQRRGRQEQGRGLARAARTTGKLMHGLVRQPVTPSPHAEYLGTTYVEVSNADRSSALGLRLNQQNKTDTHKKNSSVIRATSGRSCNPYSAEATNSFPGGAGGWRYPSISKPPVHLGRLQFPSPPGLQGQKPS